jgi:hypothetical protein
MAPGLFPKLGQLVCACALDIMSQAPSARALMQSLYFTVLAFGFL